MVQRHRYRWICAVMLLFGCSDPVEPTCTLTEAPIVNVATGDTVSVLYAEFCY